ncbi:hypothetical protein [Listeria grandensis]|uniref:hypothetical protein n=1 Tax=Listeria grandensis TaxID=1494963 RepID=UPI00164D6D2A|nr:hypothetical protein [Listeria grandensis]MBC6314515.1 hypothetical protein [Listeria grandensis]
MKKGLSRLLLVTIAITMIVSTIPAYEPYAEQGVPPAEGTIEGASEKATIKTVNSGDTMLLANKLHLGIPLNSG